MFYTHLNYLSAVEELKRFMEVAKLQNPTRRSKEKPQPKVYSETVKQEDDGTVSIKKMEIRPSSSGRERFGSGTKTWPKHPIETTPSLQRFSK